VYPPRQRLPCTAGRAAGLCYHRTTRAAAGQDHAGGKYPAAAARRGQLAVHHAAAAAMMLQVLDCCWTIVAQKAAECATPVFVIKGAMILPVTAKTSYDRLHTYLDLYQTNSSTFCPRWLPQLECVVFHFGRLASHATATAPIVHYHAAIQTQSTASTKNTQLTEYTPISRFSCLLIRSGAAKQA
jgi:hypothetical protein